MRRFVAHLFGGIQMTWPKTILFAIAAGVYTGIINQIPFLKDTSFQDIAVTFEWWVFFAVIIAANVKSAGESALKIFVFFLISQPLVFIMELPMLGFDMAVMYYSRWIIPTLLTLPGGFIAYYAKKDSLAGALVLSCATALLSAFLVSYGWDCIESFPRHLLTVLFVLFEIVVFIYFLQRRARFRILVAAITVIAMIFFAAMNYNSKRISAVDEQQIIIISASDTEDSDF